MAPAVVTWIGASGDWGTASNWDTGSVPGPGDDVVIDKPEVLVTHSAGTHRVDNLSVSNSYFALSGGILNVDGIVQGTSPIQLAGGTLANATVANGTSVLGAPSGSLRNVTIDGVLNLAAVGGGVGVYDGLTLNGVAYLGNPSSSGSIADLVFVGTQTLDGTGTVEFGGSPGNSIGIASSDTILTIGPGITVKGKHGAIEDSYNEEAEFINYGTINSSSGGVIKINVATWTNHGAIIGGSLELYGTWSTTVPLQLVNQGYVTLSGNWTNNHAIHVQDSELRLEGTWTNSGDITAVNSRVYFGSSGSNWTNLGSVNLIDCITSLGSSGKTFEIDDLGDFHRVGGFIYLHGTVLNTDGTLEFNAETGSWHLSGGKIVGGTIASADGEKLHFTAVGGTLQGVTISHDMDLTAASAYVRISDGITFENVTVSLGDSGGNGGWIEFDGTQTWNGTATFIAGTKSTNAIRGFGGGTLTLGPGITIRGHTIALGNAANLVIHGTVWADQPGGTFTIDAINWTNLGNIKASNGASLVLKNTWSTASAIEFSGGGNLTFDGTWIYGYPLAFFGRNLTFGGAFTLSGAISAVNATVKIGSNTNWSNTDTIDVTGCDVTLGGIFAVESLGVFQRSGGTVRLTGTLNNIGRTLNLNASTGSWDLSGGTILGGTVQQSEGAYLFPTAAGGTFGSFVTFNGDLDLTRGSNVKVDVLDGLVLNGSAFIGAPDGTTTGILKLVGGTLTTTNTATVVFGGSTLNYLYVREIGPNVTIRGKSGRIMGTTPNFTNFGLIQADTSGGTLIINSSGWNNSGGSIEGMNGGSLTFEGSYTITAPLTITGGGTLSLKGTWTNNSTVTAVGGTVNLGEKETTKAWSNAGVISVADATLYLYAAMTTPGLGDIQRTNGTVYFAGTLDNAGDDLLMDDQTGTWILDQGTIVGGSVTIGSEDLVVRDGELRGVTWNGDMDLTQYNSLDLEVYDGLELNGTAYLGNSLGTIGGTVHFRNAQTVWSNSAAMFVVGPASNNRFWIAGNVTFAPTVTVTGKSASFDFSSYKFVNQGAIIADDPESFFEFKGDTFTNEGLLRTANGATLRLGGSWSNAATIEVTNGSLELDGSFATAGLGTIVRSGGMVGLQGTLTNSGSTLALDASTGSWLFLDGKVVGGMITHSDGASLIPTALGGILDGVTINGDLDLTQGTGVTLTIWNGLTLNGTAFLGNAAGTSDGNLTFSNTQTLGSTTGAIVVFGGHTSNGILSSGTTSQTLTIGPNVTVRGKNGRITTGNMTLANQGTISADVPLGVIQLIGKAVNTTGTLKSINGGTLSADGVTFTFTNAGQVTIGPRSKLTMLGIYVQTAGATSLQRGQFSAGTVQILGGVLAGNGSVNAAVVNSGELMPGGAGAAGTLVIKGNYTENGTLFVDIGGTAAGIQFDQLIVTGSATLAGGSLNVTLINGFIPDPQVPDEFAVLTFGSHNAGDEFASYIGLDLDGGLSLIPVYGPSHLTLVASMGLVPPPTSEPEVLRSDVPWADKPVPMPETISQIDEGVFVGGWSTHPAA